MTNQIRVVREGAIIISPGCDIILDGFVLDARHITDGRHPRHHVREFVIDRIQTTIYRTLAMAEEDQ